MITVKLRYSDGVTKIKQFKTMQEAEHYINNEGDHLLEATYIDYSLNHS